MFNVAYINGVPKFDARASAQASWVLQYSFQNILKQNQCPINNPCHKHCNFYIILRLI